MACRGLGSQVLLSGNFWSTNLEVFMQLVYLYFEVSLAECNSSSLSVERPPRMSAWKGAWSVRQLLRGNVSWKW